MPGTHLLQSIRQFVTPIAFNAYDNASLSSGIETLAMTIDNTILQEDPVDLEFWSAWFSMREWVDEKTTQDVFKGNFTIPIRAYEVTAKANVKKLRRPNSLAKLEPTARLMAEAFVRDQVGIVMDVLRTNPLAYDGQNLFDTDHEHPDETTYSNIFDFSDELGAYSDANLPTVTEIKDGLHGALGRLVTNRAVRSQLLSTAELTQNITVLTHKTTYWTQFNKLLSIQTIDQVSNEFFGGFQLLHDPQVSDNDYEVLFSAPGGPRPTIFVVDEQPSELKFGDSREFDTGEIRFGLEGYFGAKPGWPQTIVRVTP